MIAIAGFVLAGLRSRTLASIQAAVPDATQQGASAPTGAASTADSGDDVAGGPGVVGFAPGSYRLSERATAKMKSLAEVAHKERRAVLVRALIEARPDRTEQLELARKRSFAIRQVFEANGVALAKVQIEFATMPPGPGAQESINRLEVVLR